MTKPTNADPAPLADRLREALAEVPRGRTGREPSRLREYVREVFGDLAAKREAGATWDGLAAPFAALGILMPDGTAPTGVDLRNAFHAERYKRGDKRKRRKGRAKASSAPAPAPPQPSGPRPPQATEDPAKPQPTLTNPANPWAEVERQTAEAKARREEAERSKDWNPYATPKEKPE